MKRFCLVLLFLFSFLYSTCGQGNEVEERAIPRDSLPDLWIVTIDMSKSMLEFGSGLSLVPEKVRTLIQSNCIKGKEDVYVLQYSGADKEVLLTKNRNGKEYTDQSLVADLIHKSLRFEKLDKLIARLRNQVGNTSNFVYNMSFTSLIRPLSIYELVLGTDVDFSQMGKIYHILITDDGDVNDQWMQDYKWMRKWAPKHFSRYNEILTLVACSEFDFTSRKAGKFIEMSSSVQQPRIYLSEYETYQNSNPKRRLQVDSLVEVLDFHDSHFVFKMKPCGDSIGFVYVATCCVNGNPVVVNQYLFPGDTILVNYDNAYANAFHNKVTVEGYYQEKYNDRILGQRYRKVDCQGELDNSFVTAETKVTELKYLMAVFALLLAVILAIIIWRNHVVLSICVNGMRFCVKRKAMNRLKNDDFTLLTVQCDNSQYSISEHRKPFVRFLLGRGFFARVENQQQLGMHLANDGTEKSAANELLIESNRIISPISTEMVYEKKRNGKCIKVDFNENSVGDEIHFCYSVRLSHNLIIKFIGSHPTETQNGSVNILRTCNLKMLSVYANSAFDLFNVARKNLLSEKNHVQVNIIKKEALGSQYKNDYAVLNIYDHNSRNSANRIFLRYSLACFFDLSQTTEREVTDQLINVARYVLQSERQKSGFIENEPNVDNNVEEQGLDVDVSPMLSYLYLLKKGKSRLVYSPFEDGCAPLSDGRPGLVRKTIKVFPNATMALLNLPFKYRYPEMKVNGPTKVVFEKCYHEAECMDFLGADRIKFLNVEKDWTMGAEVATVDEVTLRSWSLGIIVDDVNHQSKHSIVNNKHNK